MKTTKTAWATAKEGAITTHNRLDEVRHFAIYDDGIEIKAKVKTSTVTIFVSIPEKAAITLNGNQAFLESLTEFTVYSWKLIGLVLTFKIVETHPEVEKPIAIFTDNQTSIAGVQTYKQWSGQFVLKRLLSKIQALSNDIRLRWILTSIGVPDNKALDVSAKKE